MMASIWMEVIIIFILRLYYSLSEVEGMNSTTSMFIVDFLVTYKHLQ